MTRTYGAVTAGILALLGCIHLFWAAGGRAGSRAVIPERGGRPVIRPTRGPTVAVAGGLFGGALVLLARLGIVRLPLPDRWVRASTWALAALFALRAVGEFRYVGIFKRVKGTTFARWDSRLFTPLCMLIALGAALSAAAAPNTHGPRTASA